MLGAALEQLRADRDFGRTPVFLVVPTAQVDSYSKLVERYPGVRVVAERLREERGILEIARAVGVVAAITPSTNPAATPANKIINALKCGNAVIVAPSPKGYSSCALLIGFITGTYSSIYMAAPVVLWLEGRVGRTT